MDFIIKKLLNIFKYLKKFLYNNNTKYKKYNFKYYKYQYKYIKS